MYQGKNRYYKNSKINEARLNDISLRPVNTFYLRMQLCIAECCEAQSPYSGQVELDESYFGPHSALRIAPHLASSDSTD
jgi:hypothetical protein